MSDRSTNQVLIRRLGALSIDVGTVASITALAAWAKAERFIPTRVESGSGLPIWSTVDQARRDDIAQDSWNRMQKVGNTEYVWTRNSLLTIALVGLGAAALVFLLIPAVVRSTIGKKTFRIRSKKKTTDNGTDGGQLDRRTSDGDSDTSTIDLDHRLSETNAAASAAPSSTAEDGSSGVHPSPADEVLPTELETTPSSVSQTVDLGGNHTGSSDDLLPIDVLPLDTVSGVPVGEAHTNPTSRSVIPLTDQPIDVEAGGLLGMEVSMEVSEDLPAPWPNQPIDVGATVSDDAAVSGAALPDAASGADASLESVSASVVETPNAELPDLGFRQPAPNSTLSEAATLDGGDEEFQALPPPPLHRAVKWDPPMAEPAPVWTPETDQSPEVEQLVATDLDVSSNSDPLTHDSTEVNQTITGDMPAQATAVIDEEPSASTPPSWNEDWQAWIYWDQAHSQWLRHDVEADIWVPLS